MQDRASKEPMNKRVSVSGEIQGGEALILTVTLSREKMASLFVFQGETSEHLWCSSVQHAGLELQAALVDKNA